MNETTNERNDMTEQANETSDAGAQAPEAKPLRWELIGHCGVDAGLLMIGDPCYFVGTDSDADRSCGGDWGRFLEMTRRGDRIGAQHQLKYTRGHDGLGVMAGTAWGDGYYPVFAWKRPDDDRAQCMLVVTGEADDLPLEVVKLMNERSN